MGKTIMIVDDSDAMRQMIRYTLKEDGHEVLEGSDGKFAMEILKDRASAIDMIITDLKMPNMDGISFIRAVRSHPECKSLPILMLTVSSDEEKREEGINAGATAWIVKPFTPSKLLTIVKKLVP